MRSLSPSFFNVHRPLIGMVLGFGLCSRPNSGCSAGGSMPPWYQPQCELESGQVFADSPNGYGHKPADENTVEPAKKADRFSRTPRRYVHLSFPRSHTPMSEGLDSSKANPR